MRGLLFICNTPSAAMASSVLHRRVESATHSRHHRSQEQTRLVALEADFGRLKRAAAGGKRCLREDVRAKAALPEPRNHACSQDVVFGFDHPLIRVVSGLREQDEGLLRRREAVVVALCNFRHAHQIL